MRGIRVLFPAKVFLDLEPCWIPLDTFGTEADRLKFDEETS